MMKRQSPWPVLVLCLVLGGYEARAPPEPNWYFGRPTEEVFNFLASGVQPRTRVLYQQEWDRFLERTHLTHQRWDRLDERQRDSLLAHYMVSHRSDQAQRLSKTEGGYLISHLRMSEPFDVYRLARRVMATWAMREPPKAAWPATPELTESLAAFFCLAGEPGGAVACLLCFSCLLRIGEALSATWESLYIPAADDPRQEGALHLPSTKRGEAYVPITDPALLEILRRQRARARKAGSKRICGIRYGRFRSVLLAGLKALHVPEGRFRSHSFRRGGATWWLQHTKSVEYVVVLGRWASLLSARRYLKQGEALLARHLAELTVETHARMQALRMELASFLL